jgi:hypothetical protein
VTLEEFHSDLRSLVDAWCDRRDLVLLRVILRGYPMASGITDEWGDLAVALKTIRAQHKSLLAAGELDRVIASQQFAESLVYSRA